MNRSGSVVLAAIAGGLIVGAIVWFAKPSPQAPLAQPAAHQVAPPAAVAKAQPAAAPDSPPPWANSAQGMPSGTASSALAGALHAMPVDPQKTAARAAVRARLAQLTANGRHPTLAEMNDVLGQMERAEGSSVVAGVNLEAVRTNLVQVEKLSRLGKALQAEAQKPGGGDKQKLHELMRQMQQVEAQMRYDVSAAPPSTSALR